MTSSVARASRPLVSVVMPVYNGREHLEAAVRSILTQTVEDLELVIIDDGSTDGSLELALSLADTRTRVVRADHGGEGAARNLGLDESRGRWIAWHDADDVALPHRLQALLDAVATGADFAHSDMLFIDEQDRPTGYLKASAVPARHVLAHLLREGTPFNNGSMIVRRTVLDGVRFNEALGVGVDTDFVRRFAPHCTGVHVPEPLSLYRRHARSASASVEPARLWPHVRQLVEQESAAALVPEAFRPGLAGADRLASAMIGLCLFRRGFEDGAAKQFDTATGPGVAPTVAPLIAASIDLALGSHREALQKLSGAPVCAPALVMMGDACAGLGDLASAMTAYREALVIDPDNYDALAGIRAVGEARGLRVVDDPRRRLLDMGH